MFILHSLHSEFEKNFTRNGTLFADFEEPHGITGEEKSQTEVIEPNSIFLCPTPLSYFSFWD
jgi:hypothetical protein